MNETSSVMSGLLSFTPEYVMSHALYGGAKKNNMYVLSVVILLIVIFVFYCKCNDPVKMLLSKLRYQLPKPEEGTEKFASNFNGHNTKRF